MNWEDTIRKEVALELAEQDYGFKYPSGWESLSPAGRAEWLPRADKVLAIVSGVLEGQKKQGRQEVVYWIRIHGGSLDGSRREWLEQLKDWGLSDE